MGREYLTNYSPDAGTTRLKDGELGFSRAAILLQQRHENQRPRSAALEFGSVALDLRSERMPRSRASSFDGSLICF